MAHSWTYQITQYDPADRDDSGAYIGDVEAVSDEGPLETAYLDAVEAFARELGVTHLEVRDPSAPDPDDVMEPEPLESDANGPLADIFGDGLTGFVDGAVVDIAAARSLVRGMLRDGERTPGWCRLESRT